MSKEDVTSLINLPTKREEAELYPAEVCSCFHTKVRSSLFNEVLSKAKSFNVRGNGCISYNN
jgi:hypothetical protein